MQTVAIDIHIPYNRTFANLAVHVEHIGCSLRHGFPVCPERNGRKLVGSLGHRGVKHIAVVGNMKRHGAIGIFTYIEQAEAQRRAIPGLDYRQLPHIGSAGKRIAATGGR